MDTYPHALVNKSHCFNRSIDSDSMLARFRVRSSLSIAELRLAVPSQIACICDFRCVLRNCIAAKASELELVAD